MLPLLHPGVNLPHSATNLNNGRYFVPFLPLCLLYTHASSIPHVDILHFSLVMWIECCF